MINPKAGLVGVLKNKLDEQRKKHQLLAQKFQNKVNINRELVIEISKLKRELKEYKRNEEQVK